VREFIKIEKERRVELPNLGGVPERVPPFSFVMVAGIEPGALHVTKCSNTELGLSP
jgi:hypothetical protein